jgi:S-DNA-T family DNA segregation ATPase FtsK/SpoIIIE
MPHIVCVLPEIAGAMTDHRRRALEDGVVASSAKARAAGIHLILATRHPDREILSARIQSSIAVRLCFRTATDQESLLALKMPGAERLTGAGDMFYTGGGRLWRLQAPHLAENDAEVLAAVNQCLNA